MRSPLAPSIVPAITDMNSLEASTQKSWLPQTAQKPRCADADDRYQVTCASPRISISARRACVAAT